MTTATTADFAAPAAHPTSTTSRRPLAPTLTVRAARDAYLAENGFDLAGYTAETFDVEVFGTTFTYPNTRDRKWAIPLHDLHHAATGYGTDLVGEAEVGAFELVGGCKTPIVYALNGVAVAMGLAIAPLRTLRAFAAARGARALFRAGLDYDALLDAPLGDLRARLGLPREGLARSPRRLHDAAESARTDAMPSAPPLAGARLAVALACGVAALVAGAGLAASGGWLGLALAAAGATLTAGALAARKGSLGGRALTGHAALAVVATALGAAVLTAPIAAIAALPGLAVLAALVRP